MHEARTFIEVAPGQFASMDKVMQDEAVTVEALNTARRRLEALAEEMALEIRGMKVLGAVFAEEDAIGLLQSAVGGERFKTPYVARTEMKTVRGRPARGRVDRP